MYGYACLWSGRYPEAIHQFQEYARLVPTEPNPWASLAEASLVVGQPDRALENYARAMEVDPTFIQSHHGRAWAYGMKGQYDEALAEEEAFVTAARKADRPVTGEWYVTDAYLLSRVGRYREAEARAAAGRAAALEARNDFGVVGSESLPAIFAFERGRFERALELMNRIRPDVEKLRNAVERLYTRNALQAMEVMAKARLGRLDAARAELAELDKSCDWTSLAQKWWCGGAQGEVALASGDLNAAESAFTAAEPSGKMTFTRGISGSSFFNNDSPWRDGLARVKVARGDLPGAIQIYRSFLTPDIGRKFTSLLEPRDVLALARLLDKSGDTAGARAQYRRFLDLWKHADPGQPELAEARRKAG